MVHVTRIHITFITVGATTKKITHPPIFFKPNPYVSTFCTHSPLVHIKKENPVCIEILTAHPKSK